MVESPGKRPTKKRGAKKSKKATSKRTSASPKATLEERERQLRDLTEQSLHFLDLLQTAREKAAGVEQLEHRIGKLEEVLADARRRVRASRSVLLQGGRGDSTTRVEIVIWPPIPGAMTSASVRELAEAHPTVPIHCICPAEDAPIDAENKKPANLQVLAAECVTGPQFWNTAMAATEAPLVLFLAAGVQPVDGLDPVRAVEDEILALGQPALVHGEGQITLGLREIDGFDFERSPAPHGTTGFVELDYIAPEAFVIRRDAFHVLGPFDEDLQGYLALVDYSLRARDLALRSLGVPGLRMTLPDGLDLLSKDEQSQRDRLVLLAQHRPGQVSKALGTTDLLWDLPAEQLQHYLRALFLRLPGANQRPEALDVLVQEAVTLSAQAIPGPVIDQPLTAFQELVESCLDQGPTTRPSLEDHTPIDAVRIRLDTLRSTFEKYRAQIEGERSTNRSLLDRLTAQVEAERVAKKELMDKLQTYQSTVDSLKADLDSARTTGEKLRVDLEKERSVNEDVSSELEARQALVARLTGELEAERENRERQLSTLTEDLERARESQSLLDEGIAMIARALDLGTQRDPVALAESANSIRTALDERNRWVTLLLDEIQRWRLKPFPRPLTVGEKEFLRTQGQDGKK